MEIQNTYAWRLTEIDQQTDTYIFSVASRVSPCDALHMGYYIYIPCGTFTLDDGFLGMFFTGFNFLVIITNCHCKCIVIDDIGPAYRGRQVRIGSLSPYNLLKP